MLRSALLAAAVALIALAPATASAALPTPKSKTIVPGKSIGGVSNGMSVKRALGIWGPGSGCTEASVRTQCIWTGPGRQGTASLSIGDDGKVKGIVIEAGHKSDGTAVYTGPLQKWKTRKKVRLGVTAFAVFKAYPKVRGSGSGPQLGSGTHTTTFSTSAGRVYQIYLGPDL